MFCLGINIVKIQDTTSIKYTGGGKAPYIHSKTYYGLIPAWGKTPNHKVRNKRETQHNMK